MPAPANDNFASASVISGATGSTTGTNVSATTQGSEPGHYNYSPFPHYPVARAIIGPFATVWYSWTCPASGDYFFSTRDLTGASRTNFRSTIEAYTGSAVNALTRVTYLLDQASGEGFANSNFASIAFTATSGTTYYIQVDGLASGDTGNIYLTWGNYVSFRFGACNSCGPDFINEICLGTLSIADVTTDSINSFGTFSLDPGNWKIRYCGGFFGLLSGTSIPQSFVGYLNYCGLFYNTASAPTVWALGTTYSVGDVVLLTYYNFDIRGHETAIPDANLYVSTGTNSVFDPTTSSYFTMNCGTCPSPPGVTSPASFPWTWSQEIALSFHNVSIPNLGDCCSTDGNYGGCNGNPTTNPSSYGAVCPSGGGSWAATDGSGYVGGNWAGASFGSLGSISTNYATGAEAEAALQCQDTGWFKNVAGEIGTAFITSRTTLVPVPGSSCQQSYSIFQNSAKNPTLQLIWQPFTAAMLEVDPQNCAPTGSGTSWNFEFFIKNLSDIAWDNCTVTLLASGGITAPGTPAVVTLGALATTSATVAGTADPTSGFITATIQIARNGLVVTTLTYPLYPIITASLSGGVTSGTCSVPVYIQDVKLSTNGPALNSLINFFAGSSACSTTSQPCIVVTFEIDSGAVNVVNNYFSCTTAASWTVDQALSMGSSATFAVQTPKSGISAGVHVVGVTLGWCVGPSTTLALPGASFNVTYP